MNDQTNKSIIEIKDTLVKEFKEKYSRKPELFYRSPGRAVIIGEHSDYHDGFVMPAATNLEIVWAVARNGKSVRGYSEKFDEVGSFNIISSIRTKHEWMLYLQGVVEVLKRRGRKFAGIDFAIHSTIPLGSGLSSSSSLATGFAYILNDLYKLGYGRPEIAKIGCEAEWWYGTTGGIMDQYCIANAKKGYAVLLDCRKMEHEYVKVPYDIELVVFETTIRHKQIDSPFDLRKRQARKVVDIAKKSYPNKKIISLRDISLPMLNKIKTLIIEKYGKKNGEIFYRRAKHPITERGRVQKLKKAFNGNNHKVIGQMIYGCHESLKNNYEVSCTELDTAVDLGKSIRGIIGSRMIGGGFGGCTINLVKKGTAQHFAGEIEEKFRKKTGIKGNAYISPPSDGVSRLK